MPHVHGRGHSFTNPDGYSDQQLTCFPHGMYTAETVLSCSLFLCHYNTIIIISASWQIHHGCILEGGGLVYFYEAKSVPCVHAGAGEGYNVIPVDIHRIAVFLCLL